MFTGIIEEIGEIIAREQMTNGVRLTILAPEVTKDLKVNHSMNIDGACQTVVHHDSHSFTIEAVGETLTKTTLGSLTIGSKVNLERSLTLQTRLGGHLVQGHVNGMGRITQWYRRGENFFLEIQAPSDLQRYFIREGSVAVDGISLTIASLMESRLGISIIPHTVHHTTLQYKKSGDPVNIEADVMARYVEKLFSKSQKSTLTRERLKNWGY